MSPVQGADGKKLELRPAQNSRQLHLQGLLVIKMNDKIVLTLDIFAAIILAYAGYLLSLELWCLLYGLLM